MSDSDVDLIEIGYTQAEALAQDQVEAVVVCSNNEPARLQVAGEFLDVIQTSDYVDLVSAGLLTNEKTIQENPELVEGMTRAILRGVREVLDDPDEAFEICKEYIEGLRATPDVEAAQRAVLQASLEIWRAPRLGLTSTEAWDATQQVLLNIGFIQEPIDLTASWTNQFVDAAGVR